MIRFLRERWFLVALVTGVTFALVWPEPLAHLTRGLPPTLVIAVALFAMAWTMPSQRFADELTAPWASLWALVLGYGFLPSAGWLVGELSSRPDLRVGLLLAASVPCTMASCVLWTRMAGGNEATALTTVLASTLSSWVVTPLWLRLTTGAAVDLDLGRMMLDLALTLIVPVVAGQLLRVPRTLRAFADRRKAALGAVAQCFILAIVLKASSQAGLRIHAGAATLDLVDLVGAAALAMGLHLGTLFVGYWSSGWIATRGWLGFDRPRSIAVAFSASQKTLPVSLFLFERYYQETFPLAIVPLLFFHVGQLLLDTLVADRLRRK